MTRLYFNGCSHTRGTPLSLSDPQAAWPHRLADLLGASDIVNDSQCAGSNERILRTTTTRICSPEPHPDLAVIQFTYPERFEAGSPMSDMDFMIFTPRGYYDKKTRRAFQEANGPIDPIISRFCRRYYNMNIDHQYESFSHKVIYQALLLQNFFENQGIDFVFIFWSPLHHTVFESDAFKSINPTNVLNYGNGRTHFMYKTLRQHGFELCKAIGENGLPDDHFQDDAHEFIANSIFDFIKYKKHLLPLDINNDTEYEEVVHIYD